MLPIEDESEAPSPQGRVWFGNPPRAPHPTIEGCFLHLGGSINRAVTFLGFRDNTKPGGIACVGTGFFLFHKGYGYLVTVRHVAKKFHKDPFVIRATKANDDAELLDFDGVTWAYHPDPLVDLAAFPIKLTVGMGYRSEYLLSERLMTEEMRRDDGIDVGDFCYTVGLFHPVYGNKKNMPVVYSGSIALLPPPGERIPVYDEETERQELVEAYLVESRAIQGASGSPVFIRPVVGLHGLPDGKGGTFNMLACNDKAHQLGVFQGTWIGEPDKNTGRKPGVTVPVGIGVVIPAIKVLELMEVPELVEHRKTIPPTAARKFANDEDKADPKQTNPAHKEAFSSLVSAAAKTKKQDD